MRKKHKGRKGTKANKLTPAEIFFHATFPNFKQFNADLWPVAVKKEIKTWWRSHASLDLLKIHIVMKKLSKMENFINSRYLSQFEVNYWISQTLTEFSDIFNWIKHYKMNPSNRSIDFDFRSIHCTFDRSIFTFSWSNFTLNRSISLPIDRFSLYIDRFYFRSIDFHFQSIHFTFDRLIFQ